MFLNRSGLRWVIWKELPWKDSCRQVEDTAGIHANAETFNWRWYGRMIGSSGDSCTSFIHQKYENGRASYTCDSVTSKNVQDESFLKNMLNEIEYAIGHLNRWIIVK